MGVADDFLRFRNAYNLNRDAISGISYRYRRITRQLNFDFWGIDSETRNSRYVGSYGRDTAASGISDLDVAFILPDALYWQYDAHVNNGQSALLQAVKRSVLRTYPLTTSVGDGQVVVISFSDGIKFEILPTFLAEDGQFIYPNANGGGEWKYCNPIIETAAIKSLSVETNRNLKYLCRMMRLWKVYWNVNISGMLLDTLAFRFLRNWPDREKGFLYHDLMARDFFAYLAMQKRDQTYWLAPGSNAKVYRKGTFEKLAYEAYVIANTAIEHDARQQSWSRRACWRQIFGSSFPPYD